MDACIKRIPLTQGWVLAEKQLQQAVAEVDAARIVGVNTMICGPDVVVSMYLAPDQGEKTDEARTKTNTHRHPRKARVMAGKNKDR